MDHKRSDSADTVRDLMIAFESVFPVPSVQKAKPRGIAGAEIHVHMGVTY